MTTTQTTQPVQTTPGQTQIDCLVPVDFWVLHQFAELPAQDPLPVTVHRALVFALDNAEHWCLDIQEP